MKALGNALKEPENYKKTGRLYRFVGRALDAESEENLRILSQIHDMFRTTSMTATQLVHIGHPMPLAPHFEAITMLLDGFRNQVIPLKPKSLTVTLADVRSGKLSPSGLFIYLGVLLRNISSIEDLMELANLRSRLALNVNIFEAGNEKSKRIALGLHTLLDVISAFEAHSHEKYCGWCCTRMKRYWIINLKPLQKGIDPRFRGWYPAKVCETCKDNSILMERFEVVSKKPLRFT